MKTIKQLMYQMVAGDTDSIFILLHSTNLVDAQKESEQLADAINTACNELNGIFNIDHHYFLIKPDEIFQTLIMVKQKGKDNVAKKHYCGLDEHGEIITKGFDRSDMSREANRVLKQVINLAVHDQIDQIIPYLKEEVRLIKSGWYPLEDLGWAKGISSPLGSYSGVNKNGKRKSPGDWIKAAIWTNKHSGLWNAQTDYEAGSKPKFVYIDPNKLPSGYERTDLIALDNHDELPDELKNTIDWTSMLSKTIESKIETLLDACGLNWEMVVSNEQRKKLSKYE